MAYLKQKPGSIEDVVAKQQTQYQDPAYQKLYDEELKNTMGGIGSMTPKEKQSFHSKIDSQYKKAEELEEQKDRDIPAVPKYSKKGGFHYWDRPVKYNRIKKFYYHPKGAKPYPPGRYTKKEGLETMIPNKKDDVKDLKRKVTMTGEKPTKVDMEPEVKMDTQKPYSGKTNK